MKNIGRSCSELRTEGSVTTGDIDRVIIVAIDMK